MTTAALRQRPDFAATRSSHLQPTGRKRLPSPAYCGHSLRQARQSPGRYSERPPHESAQVKWVRGRARGHCAPRRDTALARSPRPTLITELSKRPSAAATSPTDLCTEGGGRERAGTAPWTPAANSGSRRGQPSSRRKDPPACRSLSPICCCKREARAEKDWLGSTAAFRLRVALTCFC